MLFGNWMFHGNYSVVPSLCSRHSNLISQLKLLIMLVAYCDFHSIHMYWEIESAPRGLSSKNIKQAAVQK